MPYNHDFSDIRNIRESEIHPKGWIDPLFVEYGLGMHGNVPSYFWRVKGTKHTFVIPVLRMNFLSSGDYEKHFEESLQTFREDYISWSKEEWNSPWAREYKEQFSRFISL
jgi:hypothetical protein